MITILSSARIHWFYGTIIGGLFVFVYFKNLVWLWSRWMDNQNYSHGPLIPLISVFLVYQKRQTLKETQLQKSAIGFFIMLLAGVLYIASLRAQVNFIIAYSLILMLAGVILFICGGKVFSELAFSIIYLVFMVPFWVGAVNKLGYLMKVISSIATQHILNIMGYPVFREGVVLHLANGSLEVADPCSGIRSLISLLALGTLIAYLSEGGFAKKTLVVTSVIPLALIGNIIRVAFFGYFLATKGILISEGFLHTLTGIGAFAIASLGLYCIGRWVKI